MFMNEWRYTSTLPYACMTYTGTNLPSVTHCKFIGCGIGGSQGGADGDWCSKMMPLQLAIYDRRFKGPAAAIFGI
jgi:hypothetical protein